MSDALTPDPEVVQIKEIIDYVLSKEHRSAWIGVGNISVHVMRTDEGVSVDLYAKGMEMETEMASCYAFDKEAQQMIEESKERNQQ